MIRIISIVLLLIGIGLCIFGIIATVKRYVSPTQGDFPLGKVNIPESIVIIALGLGAVVGSAWLPQHFQEQASGNKDAGTIIDAASSATPTVAAQQSQSAAAGVSSPVAPVKPRATISIPKNGAKVSGSGLLVSGTAGNMGSDSLWLLVKSDGVYYIGTEGSATISAGAWIQHTGQIGTGSSDVGQVFTLAAVIASKDCDASLRSTKPNSNHDLALRTLPPGCVEAAAINVVKVKI